MSEGIFFIRMAKRASIELLDIYPAFQDILISVRDQVPKENTRIANRFHLESKKSGIYPPMKILYSEVDKGSYLFNNTCCGNI